jgi:membrane associated rhomboid family serine protease
MGYEDREYMQNERGGDNAAIMAGYPACRYLIFATVLVFIAQILITRPIEPSDLQDFADRFLVEGDFADQDVAEFMQSHEARLQVISIPQLWLELDSTRVAAGQIWRLVTSAFLHDRFSPWHIIVNLGLLYWFGRRLEKELGSREFFILYLAAALFAAISYVGLQMLLGERIPGIGASGAVLAILCIYAIRHPYEEFKFFFLPPIQIRFLLLIYAAFVLHPLLLKLAGSPVYAGTASAAQLGGLVFGFLYTRSPWRFDSYFSKSIPNRSSKSGRQQFANQQIRKPGKADTTGSNTLDSNVDSILQKISDQGEDSLTDKERKVLQKASQAYRERREHD